MRYIDKPYYERRFIMLKDDDRGTANDMVDVFRRYDLPQGVHFGNTSVQNNTLYISHPGERGLYIPFEGFEMEYFTDKIHELEYLLIAQGAEEISIRWVKGQNLTDVKNTTTQGSASASLGKFASGSASYEDENNLKVTKKNNKKIILKVTADSCRLPFVPNDLHWYEYEPTWKMMIKHRNAGALSYSLRISSKSQLSLNKSEMESLKGRLKVLFGEGEAQYKSTLDTISEMEEETIWEIEVKFKPLSSYRSDPIQLHKREGIQMNRMEDYPQFSDGRALTNSSNMQIENPKTTHKKFRASCQSLIRSYKIPPEIQIELNRLRLKYDISSEEANRIIDEIRRNYKVNWFTRLFGKN